MLYFPIDKTLGTGYNVPIKCAMRTDHVKLPAILPLNSGLQDTLKKVANLPKNCLIFFCFCQYAGA